MNDNRQDELPAVGITLGDILYVVFRHKWKIALISGTSLVAAAIVPFVRPVPYKSEADLLIKYVLDYKSPGQFRANDSGIKPIEVGESVINTELAILTSLDLAQQVADAIGPEKILAKAGGGTNRLQAAGLIKKNLSAELPKRGNVIHIVFQNPNSEIVQPVLKQIVETYVKKSAEIRGNIAAFDDLLKKQTDELQNRLKNTEQQLKEAKAAVDVISLDDTKKSYTDQISKVQQAIYDAEAELAQRQSAVDEMEKLLRTISTVTTNGVMATNEVAVLPGKVTEYRSLCGRLDSLRKKQQDLLVYLTPESSPAKEVQGYIDTNEKLKKQLEKENPGLLAVRVSEPIAAATDPTANLRTDLLAETARIVPLETKIKQLTTQLGKIKTNANALSQAEGPITELQTRKEVEAEHLKIVAATLEQARIVALGAGELGNIGVIQAPSPPSSAASKLYKVMAAVLFGGMAGAFGLAFLIEFYLDRSLKRPIEVERRLGLPLFISIPQMSLNGKPRVLKTGRAVPLLPESTGETEAANHHQSEASDDPGRQTERLPQDTELVPWDHRHKLRPFYEGLRDRLITYFDIQNVTRKPKLVAVTSCAEGSGVSTIAAGLAASLSETGEGKVLLVDMNLKNGAAHHFYKGDLACGLDDALEMGKRNNALVQDHLYVVTEGTSDDKLPRILPKRFDHLVPKLHASDYDYIIFDMPQVSQVSVTPRLARFMDMVLMVVESEKTDRDVVKRASVLLAESKANVSVILNKEHSYVPKWLQQGH